MLKLFEEQHAASNDFGLPIHISVETTHVSKSISKVLHLEAFYVSCKSLDVLKALQDFGGVSEKPIIAVSASFDAMGVAPTLPAGAQVSLSPLLATLALSRIFGKEFDRLQSKYELMLILTPGASLNYEASEKFIESISAQIRSRISLLICLDDIVGSEPHRLFVFDSPKSLKSATRNLFVERLQTMTEVVEKGFSFKSASGFVPHEHIVYAEKGLTAITITTREEPFKHGLAKFSIFDRDFDMTALETSIAVVAEAIAEMLVIQTPLQG